MKRCHAVLISCLVALVGCTDLPSGPANTSDLPVKGMTLADWTAEGYGSPTVGQTLTRLSGMGVNTVTFVVTVYQATAGASVFRVDPDRTPTQQSIASAASLAKSQDPPLRVVIKLHVDVDDGSWRASISPRDPARWFEQYEALCMEWARQAEEMEADAFVFATELARTLEHESRWRSLIARVRDVYSGSLLYAASWDEAARVPFWAALDFVGIDFYAPVSSRLETNRLDILGAWQPWLNRVRLLHKQTRRDVVFTELGYRSIDGAGMHPHDFQRDAPVDYDEQADLYWAALEAVGTEPWIHGVYIWNWLVDGNAADVRKDYTPEGKPAEGQLFDSWSR